jgi:hypothetical protein
VAATCTDQVKNGAETDVDCGGGLCTTCSIDKGCLKNADCVSGWCSLGKCGEVVTTAVSLNPTRTTASGTAGQAALTVGSSNLIKIGDVLLIHQTQGQGAGAWEEATVATVDSGTDLTLAQPLANTYSSSGGNNHAQAVAFLRYGSLRVAATGSLTGPAWNGTTGGVVPIRVRDALEVLAGGSINLSGLGFRGTAHGGTYRNQNGWQGESHLGAGVQTTLATINAPNGPGGCGGYQVVGKNGTGGGGGGYGAVGAASVANAYGVSGVAGGLAVGTETLAQMFFGGAGGEGSADEDGFQPGWGGNSGGLLYVRAPSATIQGTLMSRGDRGGPGVQSCGGCAGAGMAGGGGGAGGVVYLRTDVATLGTDVLSATGGTAGAGTQSNPGGAGAVGRVRVDFNTLNGQAFGTPAATTALQQASNPDAYGAKP